MSVQTAKFKKWIDEIKAGDHGNLRRVRVILAALFNENNADIPLPVILATADIVVGMFLDECREFDLRN